MIQSLVFLTIVGFLIGLCENNNPAWRLLGIFGMLPGMIFSVVATAPEPSMFLDPMAKWLQGTSLSDGARLGWLATSMVIPGIVAFFAGLALGELVKFFWKRRNARRSVCTC